MLEETKKLALKGKEFKRTLPANLSNENINHFKFNQKYNCPDLFLYFFRKAYFLPDSTLFLWRLWPLSISFPFYKKRIKHHSIKGIIDIQRSWRSLIFEKAEKPYIIIHDQWTLNYYHWMTQALPRLLLVLKTEMDFTLLLPKDHCTEFHFGSLKKLGIENWITFEVGKTYYKVYNLIYPAHDIQIGDYHDDLMNELSAVLKRKSTLKTERKFLFIHRTSKTARKIINEDEVLAVFLFWGFIVVNFENLSFEEQGTITGEASILAGVHGAGLTNMIFMERGSKILELTSDLRGEQYYYYTLSNALGHDYYYQFCKPDAAGKSVQEANIVVDIDQLNKNLELMVRK